MNPQWFERVKNNILPLSLEKSDVKKALKEWLYQGNMYDVEIAEEICELCDHPNIRYQFEIINILNGNTLLIGSECINRFSIGVQDSNGNLLSADAAKRKVSKDRFKLITDAKVRSVINSLVSLSMIDTEFKIDSFIKYFKENGAFSPNQLFTLIWRLEKFNIQHNKTHFKLSIKKKTNQDQLLKMQNSRLNKIWICLTEAQKDFYYRHKSNL